MKQVVTLVLFLAALGFGVQAAWSDNPFTSRPEPAQEAAEPSIQSRCLMKFVIWQHQLKQKMSALIRVSRDNGDASALLILMGLALVYGALHAAGPGHGKFIALTYVLSHKTSITGGLLLGFFIALIHGASGVIGVLGLRYIIQRGVGETLATATFATQIVSFGLIGALGLSIVLINAYKLFFAAPATQLPADHPPRTKHANLLPWALAIGLVPCPAVVMVMLFCLSMEVILLGLILAACISLGMAVTISAVMTAAVLGKSGFLGWIPEKRIDRIEGWLGLLSGTAITVVGTLFLVTTILGGLP